ncbi:MAG: hypothetical protein NZ601_03320 [candidate division WOR-3 bacterium]|nr:hypothetical protein [candidate division WOR-3 bacterium]MDW7987388.1 hypothetical protein [candidate division WOR-3 bacterium]
MILEKINKTTCPFCLYGCELTVKEINKANFRIRQVEYDSLLGINKGRLCARGNMAVNILENRRRAVRPKLNGVSMSWANALETIKQALKKFRPEEVAITYDVNNTNEELKEIYQFCKSNNITNLASSYLEPEIVFRYTISEDVKYGHFSDLEESKVFLIVGDVFTKSPLIAHPILEAKYKDRAHRLYYIDSVKTRIAGFAHKFLWVPVSAEPLALLAIIAEIYKSSESKIISEKSFNQLRKLLPKIYELIKVNPEDIKEVAQSLINLDPGTILVSFDYAKTQDPLLIWSLGQILQILLGNNKKIIYTALAQTPKGLISFGELFEKLKSGNIKVLINFGDIFPYWYPQVHSELDRLSLLVLTSPFRYESYNQGFLLPTASILEKAGTINSLWGQSKLSPLASPIDGSKTTSEILKAISEFSTEDIEIKTKIQLDINKVYERALNFIESFSCDDRFTVIGSESPIGYRGYFDSEEEVLWINSKTAVRYQIVSFSKIKLITDNYENEFKIKITDGQLSNVGMVLVNTPKNRKFFKLEIDNLTKEIIIKPVIGSLIF